MESKWINVGFGIIFVIWFGWLFSMFDLLPETIPIHFNAAGEANGWGKKMTIWLLPLIAVFSVGMLLSVPSFNSKYINYPVAITTENRERQRQLMILFIRLLAVMIMGIMVYISYVSVQLALERPAPDMVYIWLFMGGIFGLMIWYMIRAKKLK
ncbi:MAG: DUF1648 domain-containing protein [Saprospiraceae bacterium]|nr:DUF1648 domain-containing protein [Saprospiraceae bacterium]